MAHTATAEARIAKPDVQQLEHLWGALMQTPSVSAQPSQPPDDSPFQRALEAVYLKPGKNGQTACSLFVYWQDAHYRQQQWHRSRSRIILPLFSFDHVRDDGTQWQLVANDNTIEYLYTNDDGQYSRNRSSYSVFELAHQSPGNTDKLKQLQQQLSRLAQFAQAQGCQQADTDYPYFMDEE
ncbi:MAG: hypothetical protein GY918_08935 [Gammaproteobacteria bacterium]|nr:hypothetical protein [Gammaproteobacteria bacterium]